MLKKIICKNCGNLVDANPRLKGNQEYCGDRECRKVWKCEWQREKMANDLDYRQKQKRCQKEWSKNKSLHQYQEDYRKSHPEYVKTNRKKQRERNQNRDFRKKELDTEKIVKMDSLYVQLKPLRNIRYLNP